MEVEGPDIGDFKDVPVIEVGVKPGRHGQGRGTAGHAGVTRRRWTCPAAGRHRQGPSAVRSATRSEGGDHAARAAAAARAGAAVKPTPPGAARCVRTGRRRPKMRVPDIGDFRTCRSSRSREVGDTVKAEGPLVTLESDKATMDVPVPLGGVAPRSASRLATRFPGEGASSSWRYPPARAKSLAPAPQPGSRGGRTAARGHLAPGGGSIKGRLRRAFRRPACASYRARDGRRPRPRKGTAAHGRILRRRTSRPSCRERWRGGGAPRGAAPGRGRRLGGIGLPVALAQGRLRQVRPGRAKPLSRIKKISAATCTATGSIIPHVTQHDEADITELEHGSACRSTRSSRRPASRSRCSAFMIKAAVAALKKFPSSTPRWTATTWC